jgi:hypothetical protein
MEMRGREIFEFRVSRAACGPIYIPLKLCVNPALLHDGKVTFYDLLEEFVSTLK